MSEKTSDKRDVADLKLLAKLKRLDELESQLPAIRDTVGRLYMIANDDSLVYHAFRQGFNFGTCRGIRFINLDRFVPYATPVFVFAWRWGAMVATDTTTIDTLQTKVIKQNLVTHELKSQLAEARAELDALKAAYARVPFSLECYVCDSTADDDMLAAFDAGWTDISADNGPGWNFLGLCPECKAEGEA